MALCSPEVQPEPVSNPDLKIPCIVFRRVGHYYTETKAGRELRQIWLRCGSGEVPKAAARSSAVLEVIAFLPSIIYLHVKLNRISDNQQPIITAPFLS
jgi:hypothetical protein